MLVKTYHISKPLSHMQRSWSIRFCSRSCIYVVTFHVVYMHRVTSDMHAHDSDVNAAYIRNICWPIRGPHLIFNNFSIWLTAVQIMRSIVRQQGPHMLARSVKHTAFMRPLASTVSECKFMARKVFLIRGACRARLLLQCDPAGRCCAACMRSMLPDSPRFVAIFVQVQMWEGKEPGVEIDYPIMARACMPQRHAVRHFNSFEITEKRSFLVPGQCDRVKTLFGDLRSQGVFCVYVNGLIV